MRINNLQFRITITGRWKFRRPDPLRWIWILIGGAAWLRGLNGL